MVVTGPKEHATDFLHGLDLMASTRLCPNVPGQQAIVAALGGAESEVAPTCRSVG
jgi:alanine-synthesizing transaminase